MPEYIVIPSGEAQRMADWHTAYAAEFPEAAHLHTEWAELLRPEQTVEVDA